MAEYIEREAAIEWLKRRRDSERFPKTKYAGLESAIFQIKHIPTADVVEVRHGAWFFTEYAYFSCSKCGASYYNGCDSTYEAKEKLRNGKYHNYCPNCGAKMDGKGEG